MSRREVEGGKGEGREQGGDSRTGVGVQAEEQNPSRQKYPCHFIHPYFAASPGQKSSCCVS